MDLVSIVIPVYNTGEPLRGCLDSVIQQTYPNLEIVVVDDQSSDPLTLSLIQEYLDKDSRIKLVRNEKNRGISFSRNAGVDNTSGKYLSFLDSDDKFATEYVEVMVKALVQNNTEFAMCHILNYAEDPDIQFNPNDLMLHIPFQSVVNMHDFIQSGNLFMIPVVACCKMMRLDVYKQLHMGFTDDLRKWEDNEWFYRCVTQFKTFSVIDFVGIYRLVHADSLSQYIDNQSIYRLFDMYRLCYKSFNDYGYIDLYRSQFMDFVLNSFSYRVKLLKNYDSVPKLTQECISLLRQFGYLLLDDLSQIKSEMLKSKLLYKGCKLILNKKGYKYYKQRYYQYKRMYDFLVNLPR